MELRVECGFIPLALHPIDFECEARTVTGEI